MAAVQLLERVQEGGARTAILDDDGAHTYGELAAQSAAVASALLRDAPSLSGCRVAIMAAPGHRFVAALVGTWLAGGVAVPLCAQHPAPELQYVLRDTGAQRALADAAHHPRLQRLFTEALQLESLTQACIKPLPAVASTDRALILYTSGTTGRPKGVVSTHANIQAMIMPLVSSWDWRADDRILHVLPLHHAHGLINALLCCLWAGATCEFLPRFDARMVWERLGKATLLMGVPTMYHKLLTVWRAAPRTVQAAWADAARKPRLMVSGSSALPTALFDAWAEVTGQRLLERYGMTEMGMALSNPLHGERRSGTVGQPLPGIAVRLVGEDGRAVAGEGAPGELQVRGSSVFMEYWNRPAMTRQAFKAGWFCTGDMAVMERGYYRILGRISVDIIKSGGYKVSALEVEEVLRQHPAIDQCAVVGVPDPEWGERICAAVVLRTGCVLSAASLRAWVKARMAFYKAPTRIILVDALPHNGIGKVQKARVQQLFAEY